LYFTLAEIVVVHITRNVKHPGAEIALSTEQIAILQYADKNILNQIFTQIGVPVHSIEKAIQRPFISLKEQAQPIQVAILHLEHQGIVCQGVQIS